MKSKKKTAAAKKITAGKQRGEAQKKNQSEIFHGKSSKGRPFKPGESGNPEGRPPRIEKLLKELAGKDNLRVSKADARKLTEYVMSMNKKEAQKVFEDDSKPLLVQALIRSIFDAVRYGDTKQFKHFLEFAFGKPDQHLNIDGIGQPHLSPEVEAALVSGGFIVEKANDGNDNG